MYECHNVYVIGINKYVLYEIKFKKANQNYLSKKPCVYVGLTWLDPDTHFDHYRAVISSNKYAMKYGIRLMLEIYKKPNPMPFVDA